MITLKANQYEGSSAEEGVSYQNIPSMPGVPFHRGRSEQRAERICELLDVKGKTVLDLGCSVGTMSNVFLKNGAKDVVGVDHDEDSIALGMNTYPGVHFKKTDITMEFLDRMNYLTLGSFDVVVWTSQFMWMVKQHGMEYALEFLWKLSTKCDVLLF